MPAPIAILVVSGNLEIKRGLLRTLNDFPVDVFTAATLAQARPVLAQRPISLVFCEERVTDGSYHELLALITEEHEHTRFVVMLSTGEWNEYLEAIRFGALDVVRCPLQPTDVELVLIRAMRRDLAGATESQTSAASA